MSVHAWSEQALSYFRSHAIEPEVAVACGVVEREGALVFPINPREGEPFERKRTLSEGAAKVIQPKGVSLVPWWPQAFHETEAVLVCEGEGDALSVLSAMRNAPEDPSGSPLARVSVATLPGTSTPAKALVADLLAADCRVAYLALDADQAGRRATARLAAALEEAGISAVSVELADDSDLAEQLAGLENPKARAEWLGNALADAEIVSAPTGPPPSSPRTLRVLDVGRMVSELPPPVPWTVEGLAVAGCLTLLTGREGEGKSLLAMSVAATIASGGELAGMSCKPGTALVIDAENGEREIHRRVHSLGVPGSGVQVAEADGFSLGRDLGELSDLLAEHSPDLLILDSFRTLWPGGDENDAAEVAAVLDPLRNLVRRQGTAALLLHHLPKKGGEYRGTTAIGAAVELGFRLGRVQGDPEARDRRQLSCFKCRSAPEPDPRWLRLHVEGGQVFVDAAEPFGGGDHATGAPTPARDELAPKLLAAAREACSWADLAKRIGRSPKDGTARRLRDDLLRRKELMTLPDGRLQRCHGATAPRGRGTVAPGKPDAIGDEEGLLAACEALVAAGEAEWVE